MRHFRVAVLAAFVLSSLGAPSSHAKENDHTLWDAWYTVSIEPAPGNSIHYAYYNDKVEKKGGRLFFQNKFWKNEEGYINEESLGAFAEDTPDLKPLFFNFRSVYRATETKIDGTVMPDGMLNVKASRGGSELPIIQKHLPKHTIFSVFFPLWLRAKLPTLKPDEPYSFETVLEDNLDLKYRTVSGLVRIAKPDEFAKKTATRKLDINYRDLRSTWYVKPNGMAVRIEMPSQKTEIEKVSRDDAERFFAAGKKSE